MSPRLHLFRGLAFALLLAVAGWLEPVAGQGAPPRETIAWLRALVIEGRLGLLAGGTVNQPRLFTETLPDGRTWIGFITEDLAVSVPAGEWALLDEAVALLLAEGDRIRELAASRAGSPDEAALNAIRKLYLESAAQLLAHYQTAAGATFDALAGSLVGVPALPDWAMPLLSPGQITLREIAGAGQLNVETLAFSGRLSGLLELPGLQTTLAVPNFSFDSMGNVDLTAYGQTTFPANDPNGLLLTIPPRRPLTVHLGDDGEFRIAGGVRLGFPDGNVVEAFFDVDDPRYSFGLAFSGTITLELAREMTVLLPVVNFNVANRQSIAALDGFRQFYGSLGQGFEAFLDDSPELPSLDDLDVGVPPEFVSPETVVPFDVIDAWIVSLGNDFVRPAVNGSYEGTLGAIREMLANLKSDIAAARTQNAPTIAQLQRLRRIADLNGDMKRMLDLGAAAQSIGADRVEFISQTQEAADEAVRVAAEYLQNTPPEADFKTGFAAVRLLLKTESNGQLTGAGLGLDLPLVFTKLNQWTATALARFGFNGDGSIADQARVDALSRDDFRLLMLMSYELDAMRQGLTGDSVDLAPIFARLEFERVRDAYNAAVTAGDIETRAVQAHRLLDLSNAQDVIGFTASDAERVFLLMAIPDTLDAIANRGSGGATGRKLAASFLEAARGVVETEDERILRRKAELFGETDPKPDFADTLDFSFYEYSFFEKLHAGASALLSAGLLDAAAQGRLQSNLAGFLRFYREALVTRFADADLVTQNLEGALEALAGLTDAIAFLEGFLPAEGPLLGEFQTSWQALHIQWIGIAEAQKAHWLLAAYLRELTEAADRYGDGVGGALRTAFETAGTEAVAGLSNVVEALAGLLNSIEQEKFTFPLPGDIEIQRLYGELTFDRSIPDWSFTFGGRLVFPEINALFELTAATLMSDGAFSLAMRTVSETAFGLNDYLSLSFAIPSPTGTPFTGRLPFPGNGFNPLLNGFSGEGVLVRKLGGGASESYTVDVDYTHLDPGHRFAVRTVFEGQRELFTPEVMLFGGTAGFDLETTLTGQPTQGGADLGVALGFLKRPGANPDPAQRTAADYFLNFAGDARFEFSTLENTLQVTLNSGILSLPPDLFAGPGDTPPTIALLSPICVRLDFDDPGGLLSWCDVNGHPVRLAINNLGFKLPGVAGASATAVSSAPDPAEVPNPAAIPGFQAGVSAVLLFRDSEFPVIEHISATLILPFSGNGPAAPARPVTFQIDGTNWRLDGLPDAASINLLSDLHLVDFEGFDLFLLAGTGFGLERLQVGNGSRLRFSIEGAIRGEIAGEILSEDDPDGGNFKFGGGATASFAWDFVDVPEFTLSDLRFSGAMKLGGDSGLILVGVDSNGIPAPAGAASIELNGIDHLFALSPATPFEIKVNGAIGLADVVFFGLKDARLVFDGIAEAPPGNNTEPQFFVRALGFREGDNAVELLDLEQLPARLTAGSIAFVNDTAPFPDRLALSNLIFTVSAVVDISLADPSEGEVENLPRLFGAVEDFQIAFPNGFAGPPTFSLNTLALTLENLTIGDMAGLSGGLVVGNLNDPSKLYFGGLLGGSFNGAKIKALVATRLDGLIGLCLQVNAGPVGIPLDGGSLGGIMLTGATGGVYFGNQFADPCDFQQILGLDPDTGAPPPSPAPARKTAGAFASPDISRFEVLTWKEIAAFNHREAAVKGWRDQLAQSKPKPDQRARPEPGPFVSLPRAPRKAGEVPCPTGDCPPATINLLCQRHPSLGQEPSADNYNGEFAESIIYKFTSLDRETVDDILELAGIDLNGSNATIAANFAQGTRSLIDSLLPRPGAGLPNAAELNAAIDGALAAIQSGLQSALLAALNAAAIGEPIREVLYKAAYAGIPCQDVTILLNGTFTWTPVSLALSATGGAVASTTGSAGLLGSLNLTGIPVGTGEFFYSLTDENGLPNPSFCGFIRAALGPLQLGRLDMALECPSCFTGVIDAMLTFVTTLSGDLATNADPILRRFIADALGVPAAAVTGSLPSFFGPTGSLDQEEQVVVIAGLLNLPELVRFLEANPGLPSQFSVAVLRDLSAASIDLLLNIYAALNPSFTFCGEVEPKLFGFSLTGGNTLVAAHLFADKTTVAGDVAFSPSYIFGNLPFFVLSGGTINNVVPALDEATMGFSTGVPSFDRATFELMTSQPLRYAQEQLDAFLSNAQLTFGYELSPFGFKIADGEGRVMLPTVTNHPNNPNRPGGPFAVPAEPTRGEVLKAALDAGLLADATWQGKGSQLADLFPDGSPEKAGAAGRELGRDYFPHGGFIGAAKVQLPRPLTDFPPLKDFDTLFNPVSDLNARFTAAQTIFNDYLLASDEVGSLTMYVPFPSPPASFFQLGTDAGALIDQISSFDFAALLGDPDQLFPGFFVRGEMQLDILGMPLAEGELVADPAAGLFRFSTSVPAESWLHDFVQGNVEVEIKTAEYIALTDPNHLPPGETPASLQPGARLQAAFNAITAASNDAARLAAINNTINRITDTLPKASMEASLGLSLPPDLTNFMALNTAAGFYAFSPRFEPSYATPGYTGQVLFRDPDPNDPGPYTLARRNGGFVAAGNFNFGFNLTDPDPNNRILINIPEVALAVTGGTSNPFPNLAGRALVNALAIPGLPRFSNGIFAFNSNPDPNASLIRLEGSLDPFGIRIPGQSQDFLTLRALNPGGSLGGALQITRTSASLTIDPAEAVMPFLGPQVAISVFGNPLPAPGSPPPAPGAFLPFAFSSTPGNPWTATVCLSKPGNPNLPPTFAICDPFQPAGSPCSVTFTPNGPVCGTITGVGLQSFTLELRIPNGFDATFFPGRDTATTVHVGGTGFATLAIDSNGRFYVDFGPLIGIGLPGVLTAGGRLEFGYNPNGAGPRLTVTPASLDFGNADLNQTVVRQFTVTNTGNGAAQVGLSVSSVVDYSLTSTGFTLVPGASRTVDLTFHPSATGKRNAILTIESDSDVTPILTRALTGTGLSVPRYVQSRDSIGFPLTALGSFSKSSVTIGNAGSAAMTITNVTSSNSTAFPISPTGGFTLQPGEERLIVVSFIPSSKSVFNATLNLTAGAPIGNHLITLTGAGGDPQWTTLLDSSVTGSTSTLRDIKMLADGTGWAIGDSGTLYETRDGGRSWTPRRIASQSLRDIHVQRDLGNNLIAAYHFEEPDGALNWRDDGPSGFRATARSTGNRPVTNYTNGFVGSGVGFANPAAVPPNNASMDYIELAPFDLPSNWAISLWVNPTTANDNQTFVAKHTAAGGNQFIFGFFSGGYHCRFSATQAFQSGVKQAGWQHLVLNASFNSGANLTNVALFRNGTQLWSNSFTGPIAPFNGGLPWVVGQEWDGSLASDPLDGAMDELYFFGRTLISTEISALANGESGQKLLIAGDNGTLLQSDSRGRVWHQVFDQNPNGWRARLNALVDYDWRGVTTVTSSGRTIVAGSKPATLSITRLPLVMVEDLFDPSPTTANDEQFDEVSLVRTVGEVLPITGEIATSVVAQTNNRHFAFTNLGRVFTDSAGLGATWQRHGTLDLPGSLNDAVTFQPSIGIPVPQAYLAVGSGGAIVRSLNNANPVEIAHGLTAEALNAIATTALLPILDDAPPFHVVGNNGTYLTGVGTGANPSDWTLVGNGLVGNNFGVSVQASTSTIGYLARVAGEQNRIQSFNSFTIQNAPNLTFYPGELDYGMIPLGQSRTLPLRLQNRGKSNLSITGLTITGNGFSLLQNSIGTVAPGDAVTLQLRYKPAVVSVLDLGQLVIATSFLGQSFRVPLEGRCQNADWEPILLLSGGVTFDGTVSDLAYTQVGTGASTVYAIATSTDKDRVFRSTNSGSSWSEITPPASTGQFFRFEGIDAVRSSLVSPVADVVALAGALHSATGIVDGRVMLSFNSGSTWLTRTPSDGVTLPFSDVAIFPDATNTDVMVCTSRGSGADVWQTVNSSATSTTWTKKTATPASNFVGGRVAIVPILNTTPKENGAVVTASSNNLLFTRGFTSEWPGTPSQGMPAVSPVTGLHFGIRTTPFFDLTQAWMVGNGGQFWRWAPLDPTDLSPFQSDTRWLPASNQNVFGTTNLEAIASVGDQNTGYIVGGSRIFRTGNNGESWDLDFEAGPGAALKSVATYPLLVRAWAGGSLARRATVWRQRTAPGATRPLLATNDIEFFAPIELGQSSPTVNVALQNIGNASLPIHHLRIESDDPIARFRLPATLPASVATGATTQLPIVFDALPDPIDLAALNSSVFLRFEDGWDATSFADLSGNRRSATAGGASRAPVIFQDADAGQRDRCLRFDGNDFALLSGMDSITSDFSISLWVDPTSTANNQTFLGKHNSVATDQLLFGIFGNGYRLSLNGQTLTAGAPVTGWQHLVATVDVNGSLSIVTLWKDGEILGSTTLSTVLVATTPTSLPWILGGDWDAGFTIDDHFTGCMDDVLIVRRVLTDGEIRMLANKSPACGEHRARLVINSGSESGERVISLRAEVIETSDLVVINTIPTGQTITVDGIDRVTPFAASIRCNSTNDTEWVENSLHRITAPAGFTVKDGNKNQFDYTFCGWNAGAGVTQTIAARPGTPDLKATYVVKAVNAIPPAPAQAPPGERGPAAGQAPGFDFAAALAGTPAGPFLRLSNANLSVGGLATNGFQVNGDLFVSLTKLHAALSTTALNVPNSAAGARFFELGASSWLLDLETGGRLLLKASPPSVSVLGYDLAPSSQFCFEMNTGTPNRFEVAFTLNEDFRPLPDFVEFKKGRVCADVLLTNGIPAFLFRFEGGLRLLHLPDGFSQSPLDGNNDAARWAVDTSANFTVNTATFSISLSQILGQASPLTLIDSAPWLLRGDLTLSRVAAGDILLGASLPTFQFNGSQIATLSGSISTGSEMNLTASLSSGSMNLLSGGRFRLEKSGGGTATFATTIRALPSPLFRLDVPALTLKSSATGFPAGGLGMPGVSFDSTGAFDTGRINLPSFSFDSIAISKPAGASKDNNYLRLKRNSAGKITFDTRAELQFLPIPGCTPDKFSLTIDGSRVDASYRGYFCVLPDPFSLAYTAGQACPLSGSAFGFTVTFGAPNCTGVSQSGVCILGNCP